MRAAWYERNGEARDVLEVGVLDCPEPGPGEVRVKVHVSGVNPSDVRSRRIQEPAFPRIVPHNDGAGIIEAIGPGVSPSRIGQRVWLWNAQWQRAFGTAAESVVLPAVQAVPLPDSMSFAEGACLGVPALTALQAVRLHGDLSSKIILVTGAGSAVGHYATQFAKIRGAVVIGTTSPDRAAHAGTAGTDHVIDYRSENVVRRLLDLTNGKGVDGIIDMDFSSTVPMLAEGVLKHNGKMVCYGSNERGNVAVPFAMLPFYAVSIQFFGVYRLTAEEKQAAVMELDQILRKDLLHHAVGARFPLEEIALAHETVEAGRTIGNVVVDIAH